MHNLDPNLAIKTIFTDEQWLFKTGIGGMIYAGSLLMLMLNFFTLPLVIVMLACAQGYLLRVIRVEVSNPGSKLPGWEDLADLFVSGLTWMAINAAFIVIAMLVVCGLALALMMVSLPQTYMHSSLWGVTIIVLGAVLFTLLSFVVTYLMVNLAVQETNVAGFQTLQVLKIASSNKSEFMTAWLTGEGLKLFFVIIPIATVFGACFLPSTVFISQVAAAKLAAQAWSETAAGYDKILEGGSE